jgi:hypothetical protein
VADLGSLRDEFDRDDCLSGGYRMRVYEACAMVVECEERTRRGKGARC